jgi:glycosyltransferase involved in cell wall biosynthesis
MNKLLILTLFVFVSIFSVVIAIEIDEKPMVVVIPSYNNSDWFEDNLNSILNQKYSNFRVIYVNDCSHDGTGEMVEEYLRKRNIDHHVVYSSITVEDDIIGSTEAFGEQVNSEKCFFTLVNNKHRQGALANLYRSIQSCKDDEIVVTVDGDDWLYHDCVLQELNTCYSKNEVWLTHGRLIEYPYGHSNWCKPIPKKLVKQNNFRVYRCPSHLRTFYAWLFKKIDLDDLLYQGTFYSMTWDLAMMFPMIEMASERHAFIDNINYVYNMANQINDNKVDPQLQRDLEAVLRAKPPYKRLAERGS